MENEMRTFGYLCPVCGKPVMAARSLFALEASGVEVECPCGGSALRTEYDGRWCKIFVPCGLCGEIHMAQCRVENLTREGGVAFGRAKTQEFCRYVGTREALKNISGRWRFWRRRKSRTGKTAESRFWTALLCTRSSPN